MQEMEARGFLVGAGEGEQFCFAVQFSEKRQAGGSSGAARILEIARVVVWRLGRVATAQTVGQNYGGMPGKIFNYQLFAACRGNDKVENFENFFNRIHRRPARTRGLDVLHGRGAKRRSES